jgi:hypothetical protein
MEISYTNLLLQNSINLKEKCTTLNTEINSLLELHKARTPEQNRKSYNKMMNLIDIKMSDTNNTITDLETKQKEINKNITDTIDCYKNIREVVQKFVKVYNNAQVGTLEGLTRESVRKYKIPANDNMTREILDQQYIEPSGGKKSKKRRKIKKRTSHKRK